MTSAEAHARRRASARHTHTHDAPLGRGLRPTPFELDEFIKLNSLKDPVSDGEFRQVMSQLPRDFEALVGATN